MELGAPIGHVPESLAPWVHVPGGQRRLLHADPITGVWALAVRYEPGSGKERHHHTGQVFGWTVSGRWYYSEYGEMYEAGSYVHEPAGSTHTLIVPDDNAGLTEVFFVIHGANLILDDDDRIVRVNDASSFLARYRSLCAQQGVACPAFA
jgi:quercetin dioxygenase-like cupin family protein